jgi:cytoskeletal protein CcmA (bactofilin family)
MPAPESSTVTKEFLPNDASPGESADSLREPTTYFETWLESLTPSSKPVEIPAPASRLDFEGTLRIDCHVAAAVHSRTGALMMGETAELQGNIFVAVAIINGLVRGDIRASERVELGSQARVIGDIETPALAIQPGAFFEGQCHFLPRPDKTEGERIARSSVDDSTGSKKSSRRTRSKAARQEDSEALALAVSS